MNIDKYEIENDRPCLHNLMQTRETVWKNSRAYVSLRTFALPKLTFVSGYVITEYPFYGQPDVNTATNQSQRAQDTTRS